MITVNKVNIYIKYRGDIDGWSRNNSKKELSIIKDDDWYLMNSLIQDIKLLNKKLTSQEYSDKLQENLKLNCENDETINRLRKLADELW